MKKKLLYLGVEAFFVSKSGLYFLSFKLALVTNKASLQKAFSVAYCLLSFV
jgi:hypothetical protein